MGQRTVLKVLLFMAVVVLLALGTLLASALASRSAVTVPSGIETTVTGQSEGVGAWSGNGMDDEGSDEGDLTAAEVSALDFWVTGVTEEEAIKVAMGEVSGKVTDVEIEIKEGREVYAVEIDDNGEETDVLVDIVSGEVVGIERDGEEGEEDE